MNINIVTSKTGNMVFASKDGFTEFPCTVLCPECGSQFPMKYMDELLKDIRHYGNWHKMPSGMKSFSPDPSLRTVSNLLVLLEFESCDDGAKWGTYEVLCPYCCRDTAFKLTLYGEGYKVSTITVWVWGGPFANPDAKPKHLHELLRPQPKLSFTKLLDAWEESLEKAR